MRLPTLLVGLALGPTQLAVSEPCKPVLPAGLKADHCHSIEPKTVDVLAGSGTSKEACQIGTTRVELDGSESTINAKLRFLGSESQVLVETTPHPSQFKSGAGRLLLACGSDQVFVVNPLSGVVSAFKSDGSPLWARSLSGFNSVDSTPSASRLTLPEVITMLRTTHSVGLKIAAFGDYILVQHRTGTQGFSFNLLHRSGRLVANWGPTDQFLVGATANGWDFVGGGGTDIRFYLPRWRFDLALSESESDRLFEHFIAWFMPRPTSRGVFRLECASRSEEELAYWLGGAYDAEQARVSRDLYGRFIQSKRAAAFLANSRVSAAISTFDATAQSWLCDFRSALLEAGLEAEFELLRRGS